MNSAKRQKLSNDDEGDSEHEESIPADSEGSENGDFAIDAMGGTDSEGSSLDTDDEIAEGKLQKSKKTLKRKRRATEPSQFGATLQSLLSTDAPTALPLSLKPSVARKKNNEKLENKAKRVLQVEKKEKEEKGRVKDVIGGWGGESERALRKVAQRGVVKLFNVIQQSQLSANAAAEDAKASRGTGKPSLPAPTMENKTKKGKGKHEDNVLGRGKETAVEKDKFFDMIRSGGLVSSS